MSLCDELNINHISEFDIGIPRKKDVKYIINGVDRSGWLIQQFIKLSGDKISSEDIFLVIDADTCLLKKQSFQHDNKSVILFSDEYHKPYYDIFKKIFGYDTCDTISCVSHQMMFEKKFLKQMKEEIEKRHNCFWIEAIMRCCDFNEASCFSEYELYGHWMIKNHNKKIIREYFNNLSLPIEKISDIEFYSNSKYKSISFHSYL